MHLTEPNEGSAELNAFIKLYHFIIDYLEEKVMNNHSHFPLEAFDEVTLRRIRCSWVHKLSGHKDRLLGWTEGKEGGVVRQFRVRLAYGSFEVCLYFVGYPFLL